MTVIARDAKWGMVGNEEREKEKDGGIEGEQQNKNKEERGKQLTHV